MHRTMSVKVLLLVCSMLVSVCLATELEWSSRSNLKPLWQDKAKEHIHLEMSDAVKEVSAIRAKRQSGANPPVIHGDFQLPDGNTYARIHYSGENSPVIIVLTYELRNVFTVTSSNLYRSNNYGSSFVQIDNQLDSTDGNPLLWYLFHVGNVDKNLVVFVHASDPKIFYSTDEGAHWQTRTFPISTVEGRTIVWNPVNDNWAIAHDFTNKALYVTQDMGATWTHLSDHVDKPFDYQWGDPDFDEPSTVFYNTFDPSDLQRGNFTVGLYSQTYPYQNERELDPALGRHDDFLLLGPYIFAQKTTAGVVGLYLSYKRAPFKKALIPSTDAHLGYLVTHINALQALVIVEHVSGQYNLYLSDMEGVIFSLSLPDIVIEENGYDIEVIDGVNGTLVANQFVRPDATQPGDTKRTLITLDNGGNWELVIAPDRYKNGTEVNCNPPQCSLHFHMSTSDYARLGVYSQDSAPGIILAHGSIGNALSENPDLYVSSDGGVTWEQTLVGSWGVTVADHGGLMVAARDYHQDYSVELMYTCSEGDIWTGFTFTQIPVKVFGVVTEPGEYTTTVSLYGVRQNSAVWDVVTINFSSIYQMTCSSSDFYNWQPWDERTDTDCILGSDVVIERRKPERCCLIGTAYTRTVSVTLCECTDEDYDCDYGFMHSDGFIGPCIRDPAVPYNDPCLTSNILSYNKSTGYRKIPGDVCVGGVEDTLAPQLFLCCESPTDHSGTTGTTGTTGPTGGVTNPQIIIQGSTGTAAALAVLFVLALLVAVVVGVIAVVFIVKHSKLRRRHLRLATSGDISGGRMTFRNDSDDRTPLQPGMDDHHDDDDDDDEPLTL